MSGLPSRCLPPSRILLNRGPGTGNPNGIQAGWITPICFSDRTLLAALRAVKEAAEGENGVREGGLDSLTVQGAGSIFAGSRVPVRHTVFRFVQQASANASLPDSHWGQRL